MTLQMYGSELPKTPPTLVKSFFNADSLFGKKNSLIRRAESFHQGAGHGSHNDYYLMNSKYSSKDARERAKSVDRLLSAGDDDKGDHFDKPMMKSKSMEFTKLGTRSNCKALQHICGQCIIVHIATR